MNNFAPTITQHLKRTVVAGVLAFSLLGSVAVTGAAAQDSQNDYMSCQIIRNLYDHNAAQLRKALAENNVREAGIESAAVARDGANWIRSGCEDEWGDIDKWYGYYNYWWDWESGQWRPYK